MKRKFLFGFGLMGALGILALPLSRPGTTQPQAKALVHLQPTTPGTAQSGHVNVSGTAIFGSLRLPTGASSGRVLTSDASGVGSWQPLSLSGIAAGGDLTGTYPNPLIGANKVDNTRLASDMNSLAKVSGGVMTAGPVSVSMGLPFYQGHFNVRGSSSPAISVQTFDPGPAMLAQFTDGSMYSYYLRSGVSGFALGVAGQGVGVGGATNGGIAGVAGNYGTLFEGYLGFSGAGVKGVDSVRGNVGYLATPSDGAFAQATVSDGNGVVAVANNGASAYGLWARSTSGWAGVFSGNTAVYGTLSKTAGAFKIDHPLDPVNKYLWHSFVESPDMKNIYDGLVMTNSKGEAWVTLPNWFETLNGDFRYQLTVVDELDTDDFVLVKVAKGIEDNRFKIRSSKPNVRVSWQVTGIRHDPYAERYRIPVEQMKSDEERGHYIHPELYGHPDAPSIAEIGKAPMPDDKRQTKPTVVVRTR